MLSDAEVSQNEVELNDGDSMDDNTPLDLSNSDRRLVTQPYDLAVKSLNDDIEQGRIKLKIEYQRKYIWDNGKASRLIESLLLNVPIPVVYFAEDEDGAYEVIDGLQRLTAISRFLGNKFKFYGLTVLKEFNGKRASDLPPRDLRRLENRTIRCIVITEDSDPDIKFDVFERLNTGAAILTSQELRNSVYRGPYNDSLKRLARENWFTESVGKQSNKRMELEELVLRFFALYEGVVNYKPPLRQFLNHYMSEHRRLNLNPHEVEVFKDCCITAKAVFAGLPFKSSTSKNSLNKALFDAFMIPFAFSDRNFIKNNSSAVRDALTNLEDDKGFRASVGRATADRRRMLFRIRFVESRLIECGVKINLPSGLEQLSDLGSQE